MFWAFVFIIFNAQYIVKCTKKDYNFDIKYHYCFCGLLLFLLVAFIFVVRISLL